MAFHPPLHTGEALEPLLTAADQVPSMPDGHFAVLSYQEPGSESWRRHLQVFASAFAPSDDAHLFVMAPGRDEAAMRAQIRQELPDAAWEAHVHVVVGTAEPSSLVALLGVCHAYLDDASADAAYLARLCGKHVLSAPSPDALRAVRTVQAAPAQDRAELQASYVVDQLRRQRGAARVLVVGDRSPQGELPHVTLHRADQPADAPEGTFDAVVALSGLGDWTAEAIARCLAAGGALIAQGVSADALNAAGLARLRAGTTAIWQRPTDAPAVEASRVMLLYKEHYYTTAKYFRKAFRELGYEVMTAGPGQGAVGGLELPHDAFMPDVIEAMSEEQRPQLVFYVDVNLEPQFRPRGLDRLEMPTVGYFIDSHLNLADHLSRAGQFDHVAVSHGQYLQAFEQHGIRNVFHLPCSADPEVFHPVAVQRERDVVFVGHTGVHPRRVELLKGLAERFDLHQDRQFFEACAEAFSRGHLVFNCSLNGDLNMRVFEAMAAGSLLVTDRLAPETGLERFFADGEDLVLYDTPEQLYAAVTHYLAHPEEAEAIRRRARQAILAGHTYRHRALAVLERALTRPSRGLGLLAGCQRFAAGDVDGAIFAFSAVAKQDPPSPEAFNNLAVCLAALGRPEQALELVEGALTLAPSYRAAQENLMALKGNSPAEVPGPFEAAVPAYYQFDRPEVRRLVPAGVRRVLDVGCAAGALGGALKRERPGLEVVGVEYNRHAALLASRRLDAVVQGSVDELADFPYPHGYFDCLVFADVLEHLPNPEETLKRLLPYLREGGHLVVSLPNVRHYEVVGDLLVNGRWTYQDAGILDRTHLRFYTYAEIEQMAARLGLELDELDANLGVADAARFQAMAQAVRALGGDEVAFRQEGRVVQYLLRWQKPAANAPRGLASRVPAACPVEAPPVVSIVMLTLNQLPFTQLCVESLFAHSTVPFELLVIDNASTDGTRAYLSQLAENDPRVKLIFNDANMGFAHGCNQGIAAAEGEVVVLLNNDTIVTEGWLEGLLRPMLDDPRIGAVGPRSNQVTGIQELSFVPYGSNLERLHAFARWRSSTHRGQGFLVPRAIGFCLAVKREVLETIGGFDTRYGIGNYEDDDLSARIYTSGHRIYIADDVFIHHFGHVTFTGQRVDYRASMGENWRLFAQKWNLPYDPNAPGYNSALIVNQPFNPARDVFPILVPDAPGAAIADAKGYHFLALPDWEHPEAVVEAIAAYNTAFPASDDVALLIWVDPAGPMSVQQAAEILGARLAEAGLDGPNTPELVLFDAPGNPMTISRVYRAAQACLPLGRPQVASAAQACGLALVPQPTPDALRAARGGAPSTIA